MTRSAPTEGFITAICFLSFGPHGNYQSFVTSDSAHKAEQGGKGIGRFLWLKAFESAEIQSLYEEGGQYWLRKFRFNLSDEGVEQHSKEKVAPGPRRTTVTLVGYRDPYRDKCPRSAKVELYHTALTS
jgi:hypothetical protein